MANAFGNFKNSANAVSIIRATSMYSFTLFLASSGVEVRVSNRFLTCFISFMNAFAILQPSFRTAFTRLSTARERICSLKSSCCKDRPNVFISVTLGGTFSYSSKRSVCIGILDCLPRPLTADETSASEVEKPAFEGEVVGCGLAIVVITPAFLAKFLP